MTDLQQAKQVVLDYYAVFDAKGDPRRFVDPAYVWRGVHPFNELSGLDAVTETVWEPMSAAFTSLQRRPDVFIAGANAMDGGATTWVCQMGRLMGLFDVPWLGIQPTGKMTFLRYAEFHRVEGDRIAETAFFADILSVMHQAKQWPLGPHTGAAVIPPGPLTHDGLLLDEVDPVQGDLTLKLLDEMVADLIRANRIGNDTGDNRPPAGTLEAFWHEDMIWWGPAGIGSTFTIPRYQTQHQYPFREGLADKVFNGHVTRIGEGNYAGWFGWPNLTNRPVGGFLGIPESDTPADMRVVDIYRRDGDKLAENWVFIDLLHWLKMLGRDILAELA